MRRESPKDILIWDDASPIPAAIKAEATQSDACLFLAQFEKTLGHNVGEQVLAQLFKGTGFSWRQKILI